MHNIAKKAFEILQGIIYVPKLSDTVDSIGDMDHVCKSCKALSYKNETQIMCCGGGKVCEPFLPKPPNLINDLWFHNTEEAKVFRKYCRSLNNAVCLASLVVGRKDKNKNVDSYMPTVFFPRQNDTLYVPSAG